MDGLLISLLFSRYIKVRDGFNYAHDKTPATKISAY